MFPAAIYSNEFFYRAFYIVTSIIFAVSVIIVKFDTIVVVELIPLTYLRKKLTVVEVTDLMELL